MESVSLRQITFATQQGSQRRNMSANTINRTRINTQKGRLRFSILSKNSDFQDFQAYAKPSRLLLAKEVKVCTKTSSEKIFTSLKEDSSQCVFRIKIGTSDINGSSLSDLNAGILVCLIGQNGDCILRRIPASLMTEHSMKLEDLAYRDILHFQRGSVDEFTFEGPNLGRIEALWMSLESGQWRLGSVGLTVICGFQPSLEELDGNKDRFSGFQYDFQTDDVLLGEGSDVSMVELRPCFATQLSGVDSFDVFGKRLSQLTLPKSQVISKEESMKEYVDLKLSLLLYDAMLIFVGTSVASFSAGGNTAFAFLTGGVGGFLYLLLLQRSVDGLQAPMAPSSISRKQEGIDLTFGGFKGPISSLALVIGSAILIAKFSYGDFPLVLTPTPRELVAGMLGFLSCKVAVVLAALKPNPLGLKITK